MDRKEIALRKACNYKEGGTITIEEARKAMDFLIKGIADDIKEKIEAFPKDKKSQYLIGLFDGYVLSHMIVTESKIL